ncbi:hypothetical protein BpHYR1_041953 [Brachionus plicatilis]|uniref:Uncharacterized protein n=1 Tax=Brachionus plicatilis TaxID=10195 RepID=A0A3M7PSR6_BRAPC|nr:hypothetical protein BpHYR1_041953 [Brachionus plicatilis]
MFGGFFMFLPISESRASLAELHMGSMIKLFLNDVSHLEAWYQDLLYYIPSYLTKFQIFN